MTEQEFETTVWRFYLNLEKEFINTLNYVELSEDNYSTYSIEYEKLLLSIGSEVDILLKMLCKMVEGKNLQNIKEYAQILCEYNNLTSTVIICDINKQTYRPFEKWSENSSPTWWKDYNQIKHNRLDNDNRKKGNLENVILGMSGLYLLNRFCFRNIKKSRLEIGPNPRSEIFSVAGWDVCINVGNGFYRVLRADGNMSIKYK